jgi:hypothetical protein
MRLPQEFYQRDFNMAANDSDKERIIELVEEVAVLRTQVRHLEALAQDLKEQLAKMGDSLLFLKITSTILMLAAAAGNAEPLLATLKLFLHV